MSKPFIPFGWLPGHWGLSGITRDLARIDYELSSQPYECEIQRATILYKGDELAQKIDDIDLSYKKLDLYTYEYRKLMRTCHDEDFSTQVLYLELEHKRITQREFDQAMIDKMADDFERNIAALDLLLEHNDITQNEYDKERATLEHRPWFHWDVDYVNGEIELSADWNDLWIDFLKVSGYGNDSSATPDDIIYEYVRDLGRKLSEDHPEDTMNEDMLSFIKTKRESADTISKY